MTEFYTFETDKIVNGKFLMYDNTALIEWDSDLSSLTNGYEMFAGCTALENFTADMRSLKSIPVYASGIFTNCTSLKNVDIDLSSCTGAMSMFSGCTNLEKFSGNLDSLLDAQWMFSGCSNFSSFNADVPSLTSGGGMFEKCKLNPESVNRILNSITIHEYPLLLTIGIDVSQTEVNGKDTNAQLADFAVAMGYNSWSGVTAAFSAKNCNVQFQYGGTSSIVLPMPSVPSVPSVPR